MKLFSKTKLLVWAVLLTVWLLQSLAARHPLDADAVSYLDIAYACVAGNWHALVHGYWSPAYPFLLALWIKFFGVTPFREPLAVHLFAFASLIVALIRFEHFLSVLLDARQRVFAQHDSGSVTIPDSAFQLLLYTLFFWVTTFLTPPYLEQPDILVLIVFLWAASLAMKLVLASPQSAWAGKG